MAFAADAAQDGAAAVAAAAQAAGHCLSFSHPIHSCSGAIIGPRGFRFRRRGLRPV